MADSSESNANVDSSSSLPFVPSLPSNLPISVKLTDSNFLIWQQQVEATIWGYGLEGYLTGETALPAASSPTNSLTPEMLSCRRQDQRLKAWLLSSLSESALIQVVGLKTTKDIWNALLTNYASQSMAKVMHFRSLLQHTKKENLGMQEYLDKMKSYSDFLSSADCEISERDKILYIMGGLSQEYNPVMVSISSRREAWTVQEVTALLLGFESRLSIGQSSVVGSLEVPNLHSI